jgi:hypothetical protein
LVREDVANVDLAAIEVDWGNEVTSVAANVKHDKLPDSVCRWKSGMQGIEATELALAHDFEPTRQGTLAVWMLLLKATECFLRNDVHAQR